jgi:uncharacterized protein (UPF0332 family)
MTGWSMPALLLASELPSIVACKWNCFRRAAGVLKQASGQAELADLEEQLLRASVSRHYYSAFHRCRKWLGDRYQKLDNKSHHESAWRILASVTRVGAFFAQGFDEAHANRCIVDYDIDDPFSTEDYDRFKAQLDNLHKLLKALPAEWPADPQLQEAETQRLKEKVAELWPL